MKVYTEEQLKLFYQLGKFDGIAGRENDVDEEIKNHTPIELPNDEEIKKHIDYLITCRQNLIDNADKIPQHLLEGGCMAFESAIDNARELFLKGNMSNNKQQMKFYKNKFTNVMMSENDYKYLSDSQKSQMILIQGDNK